MTSLTPLQRFMKRVSPCPITGCWWWTGGARDSDGYGCMSLDNVTVLVHRFSWMVKYGEIPIGFLFAIDAINRRA